MSTVTTSVQTTTLDTEAVPAVEEEASSIVVVPVPVRERPTHDLSTLVEYAAPVFFAVVAVVFAVLSVQRIEALVSWPSVHAGSGQLTVLDCRPQDQWGSDQWLCQARLVPVDGSAPAAPTTLVVSKGALVSDRPYVGEELEVYFRIPDGVVLDGWSPDRTYSQASQLTELARLYFSLIPLLLIVLGSMAWLAGWFIVGRSRRPNQAGWWERIPFRFTLQRRGIAWVTLGVLIWLVNIVLVLRILGSVGAA